MITKFSMPAIVFLALILATGTYAAETPTKPPRAQFGEYPSNAEPAATLPDYYPASFQSKGTIQSFDGVDTLFIDGVRYRLVPNVQVHTLNLKSAPKETLASGMDIAFTLGRADQRGRIITEIWVLPEGTVLPR